MRCLVSVDMNTSVRTSLQIMKAPLRQKKEKTQTRESSTMESKKQKNRCSSVRDKKMALQQEVDKLKKKLRQEENVHRALERAFTRPLGALPRLPPYLPPHTLALLAEVAVLEEEIVRLEELVMNFRQGLYQEAVHISSSKKNLETAIGSSDQNSNKNNKTEQTKCSREGINETLVASPLPSMIYDCTGSRELGSDVFYSRIGHCSTRPTNGKQPTSKHLSHMSLYGDRWGKENKTTKNSDRAAQQKVTKTRTSMKRIPIGIESIKKHAEALKLQVPKVYDMKQESLIDQGRIGERSSTATCGTTVEEDINDPNRISEDLVKCLSSIFMGMSTPKAMGKELDASSSAFELSSHESFNKEDFLDPYAIFSEFERRDIGPYKHVIVIDASLVDTKRVTNSLFLIQRLKLLLEKLSMVDLQGLSQQQKLAFWINIYNSCMMNAFLEHGIPTSPETLVVVLQKAMINVGGHSLNAMMIENFILRLPYHSKCGYTKCSKNDELMMQNIFGLDWPEPLVTFALSCGSWSSPLVRVYTASQVEAELQAAKRDYLQAAVGISTTNVAIPKLLDWYLLDFAKDIQSLLDWVCLQLPNEQRKEAIKCLEKGRNGTAWQSITITPYDFSFRYLLAT